MMIGESLFAGDGESPLFEVGDERAGIADAAESVERAAAEVGDSEELLRCGGEFAKAEQASLRGKDSSVLQFADGGVGAGIGFGASENEKIGSRHGGEGLAKTAGRKEAVVFCGAGGIEEEDVDVAGELEMLEAVVQQEDVDAGLL